MSIDPNKILQWKMKYWSKTVTDDSIFSNMASLYSAEDRIHYIGDITISDTLFSSITGTFNLGLSLSDITPWNLAWSVELPSPDEFAKGKLIELNKIGVDGLVKQYYPELQDVMLKSIYNALDFMDNTLDPQYSKNPKEGMIEKGYYGEARFGYFYYDPVAVAEFFKSSVYAFFKKKGDIQTAKARIEAASKTLEIDPELTRTLFNNLSKVTSVKIQALTWDYGWWDFSLFSTEGSPGRITYVNYDLQETEAEYEDLIDCTACGYWDEYAWDYFYWCDIIHPWKLSPPVLPYLVDLMTVNFRNRIPTTALAVANYERPEGRSDFTKSIRADDFGVPVFQRAMIENTVENLIKSINPDIPPVTLNMYKMAALHLYGVKSSPHKWGYDSPRAMSDEELRDWWIDKWASSGLDRDILSRIYDVVKTQVNAYSSVRASNIFRSLRSGLR